MKYLLTLMAAASLSWSADHPSLKASAAYFKSAQAFDLSLTQEIHIDATGEVRTTKGSLLFDQTGRFLFKTEQMWLSLDRKEFREFRPGTKQIVYRSADKAGTLTPGQVLTKYLECPVLKADTVDEQGQKMVQLRLDPKGRFPNTKDLTVWLRLSDNLPAKIQALDPDDNATIFVLKSIKKRAKVKDADFRIAAPKGAEVLDLR